MKAKEYMNQVAVYQSAINSKKEEIATLRSLVQSTTAISTGEKVLSSGTQDKMADAVVRIVDLMNELANDILKYAELRAAVSKVILKVREPDLMDVLYKRYCEFKPWEVIACEMNYTYRWVTKLNGKALTEVQKILDRKVG